MENLTVKRFIPRGRASPGSSGRQPAMSHAPPTSPPQPRLLDQVRLALRARHYSRRTEEAYVAWIKRYIFFFHAKRHPADMGEQEVRQFLTDLAVNKKVSASTQNQALSTLLFLYQQVLNQPIGWISDVVRAKRPK